MPSNTPPPRETSGHKSPRSDREDHEDVDDEISRLTAPALGCPIPPPIPLGAGLGCPERAGGLITPSAKHRRTGIEVPPPTPPHTLPPRSPTAVVWRLEPRLSTTTTQPFSSLESKVSAFATFVSGISSSGDANSAFSRPSRGVGSQSPPSSPLPPRTEDGEDRLLLRSPPLLPSSVLPGGGCPPALFPEARRPRRPPSPAPNQLRPLPSTSLRPRKHDRAGTSSPGWGPCPAVLPTLLPLKQGTTPNGFATSERTLSAPFPTLPRDEDASSFRSSSSSEGKKNKKAMVSPIDSGFSVGNNRTKGDTFFLLRPQDLFLPLKQKTTIPPSSPLRVISARGEGTITDENGNKLWDSSLCPIKSGGERKRRTPTPFSTSPDISSISVFPLKPTFPLMREEGDHQDSSCREPRDRCCTSQDGVVEHSSPPLPPSPGGVRAGETSPTPPPSREERKQRCGPLRWCWSDLERRKRALFSNG